MEKWEWLLIHQQGTHYFLGSFRGSSCSIESLISMDSNNSQLRFGVSSTATLRRSFLGTGMGEDWGNLVSMSRGMHLCSFKRMPGFPRAHPALLPLAGSCKWVGLWSSAWLSGNKECWQGQREQCNETSLTHASWDPPWGFYEKLFLIGVYILW